MAFCNKDPVLGVEKVQHGALKLVYNDWYLMQAVPIKIEHGACATSKVYAT